MSSTEYWRACKAARHYGSDVCRLDRAGRIAWAENQIAALKAKAKEGAELHRAKCNSDVCSHAFESKPHNDEIAQLQVMIELEKRDEAYAAKSRVAAPEYREHIDGFCQYRQNLRARLFEAVGYKCEACGENAKLDCHHRHYDTLGFEEIEDVKALCRTCHSAHHRLAA